MKTNIFTKKCLLAMLLVVSMIFQLSVINTFAKTPEEDEEVPKVEFEMCADEGADNVSDGQLIWSWTTNITPTEEGAD